MSARPESSSDAWLSDVEQRLRENRRVRRTVEATGRLHVERQLPFLVVHRQPDDRPDPGTAALVTSTASWLVAPGARRHHRRLQRLVDLWTRTMTDAFGATLILEIWSEPSSAQVGSPVDAASPAFRILAPRRGSADTAVQALAEALKAMRVRRRTASAQVEYARHKAPPGLPGWLGPAQAVERRCSVVGLVVRPIYVDPETGELFPLVLRTLTRRLGQALHKAFFEFVRNQTTHRPTHFHELGRRALSDVVKDVDRRLAGVGESFDFLVACTPVNAEAAWQAFRRSQYEATPVFHYRPLTVDPARVKRELYAAPLERVEDPALAGLLRSKRQELDRQLTLLGDRQTDRFLPGVLALYGRVEDDLARLARRILQRLPAGAREGGGGRSLDARALARLAEAEFAHYRSRWPGFEASVQVRGDLPGGLIVSHGRLLIGEGTRIAAARAEALLQHEIGTHVLTYVNGRAQPFQQLCVGLDGYEALQEGLAVLAEYLVGGLDASRLRLLAARVVAARSVERGASFLETFGLLVDRHGFGARTAFSITMRVHRAGGLTKDAVYLRGLRDVVVYLRSGADLERLFVGKIAVEHLGTVRELTRRRILTAPPLLPRYIGLPDVDRRLEALRADGDVLALVTGASR